MRKMKEQQKHGCTCAVCGRKRNAIEVELEVLYDAYYDELESYANHQQMYQESGGTIAPPVGPGPFPGSVDVERIHPTNQAQQPVQPPPPPPPAASQGRNIPTSGKKAPPVSKTGRTNAPQTQPPPPPTLAAPPAKGNNAKQDKHHTHSPSCPHHPHTHGPNHHHHHHHPVPASRGKQAQTSPLSPPPGDVYTDGEEEYEEGDEEDEGDYDDEGEYDEGDDVPETEEDEMRHNGPHSEDEDEDALPPPPPASKQHPPTRANHTHPPPPRSKVNAPLPPTNRMQQQQPQQQPQQQVAPPARKGMQTTNPGNDFFGFGSSLTVKGKLHSLSSLRPQSTPCTARVVYLYAKTTAELIFFLPALSAVCAFFLSKEVS